MDQPKEGLEEPAELPDKGPDASDHFKELLSKARRLQRERGFSSKTGAEQGGDEPPAS